MGDRLGTLRLKLYALPQEMRDSFEEALQLFCEQWHSKIEGKNAATVFFSLALLQLQWNDLNRRTQIALQQLLEEHCPQFQHRVNSFC